MSDPIIKVQLPPIPAKRYFTIGEVSELCGVKPHVLRYWEQEFTQLKPVKRRGNRRYYQHHEVLLIRRIRELLYEQGFTISGARNRLDGPDEVEIKADVVQLAKQLNTGLDESVSSKANGLDFSSVKDELLEILNLLRSLPQASK
ncbi:MerR family transcriptional regulator [Methylotenera sp.]|uniref:MerR family transcriptional regulator n=1 Tax=Methylotenera sp. TaxID=2051956 RepID=UPI002731E7A5|nr:MerR family transcriptional regulator [Methylotenera sp.]MDP2229554.1 MerR family transcriptional regulator [Methylotenera sp.]